MIDEDYSMEIQGVTDNLVSVEKEQQAYKMLQSIPYSLPPAEFNWELAARGFYTKMQKERSDKALDEFEKELTGTPLKNENDILIYRDSNEPRKNTDKDLMNL